MRRFSNINSLEPQYNIQQRSVLSEIQLLCLILYYSLKFICPPSVILNP